MDDNEKMAGSDFVTEMAELGQKHANMITQVLQTVTSEYSEFMDDEKVNQIHPIFVAAGRGAYHGAMKINMKKNEKKYGEIKFSDDE